MSAKDNILNTIATNQPELIPLPEIDLDSVINYENKLNQFKTVVESIGGKVIIIQDTEVLKDKLMEDKTNGNLIINTLSEIGNVDEFAMSLSATELEKLEKAYLKGTLGVAENGAVWLYENQMGNRLLPFICQHLILVLEIKDIVSTLHHAYQKIELEKNGFGIFIAGPSKTADIEQSLVIGAHGARSATIYVVDN